MNDNRTPEERAQDHEYMRKVTAYFTEILGAKATQNAAPSQSRSTDDTQNQDKTRSTTGLGSPHLGF